MYFSIFESKIIFSRKYSDSQILIFFLTLPPPYSPTSISVQETGRICLLVSCPPFSLSFSKWNNWIIFILLPSHTYAIPSFPWSLLFIGFWAIIRICFEVYPVLSMFFFIIHAIYSWSTHHYVCLRVCVCACLLEGVQESEFVVTSSSLYFVEVSVSGHLLCSYIPLSLSSGELSVWLTLLYKVCIFNTVYCSNKKIVWSRLGF